MASDEFNHYERCIVCGEFVDYCLGHGGTTETDMWEDHENGDHSKCNPLACQELKN